VFENHINPFPTVEPLTSVAHTTLRLSSSLSSLSHLHCSASKSRSLILNSYLQVSSQCTTQQF